MSNSVNNGIGNAICSWASSLFSSQEAPDNSSESNQDKLARADKIGEEMQKDAEEMLRKLDDMLSEIEKA